MTYTFLEDENVTLTKLSSYPGYFPQPHWKSIGLSEISWITRQLWTRCGLATHKSVSFMSYIVYVHITKKSTLITRNPEKEKIFCWLWYQCLHTTRSNISSWLVSLHWRYNDHDGVSNNQPHGCLLNLLFRRWSKKTSKLPVTGLCVGNSPGPVNSPHKEPVTRKMFPFDDVIMFIRISVC